MFKVNMFDNYYLHEDFNIDKNGLKQNYITKNERSILSDLAENIIVSSSVE